MLQMYGESEGLFFLIVHLLIIVLASMTFDQLQSKGWQC